MLERDSYFDAAQTLGNAAGPKVERGVTEEARTAVGASNELHALLDELELRLFGPEPRGVELSQASGASMPPPVLAHDVRHARQRVESANGRIGRILGRL